jgi:NAD(P)-dependent dehydrogenase (short-subunit alcohol dehydrogenase family)
MVNNKFNLKGKTALITGAAGLLGPQHAKALLESGANIILTDIANNELIDIKNKLTENFQSSDIYTMDMDVSNQETVKKVASKVDDLGLRVDILINNAAINPKVQGDLDIVKTSRLENFSLEQWNLELAVGLTGSFICSQIFGASMAKDGKGGVILNIASDLSIFSPDQRLYRKSNTLEELQPVKPVTYSAIKTGLIGLTRYISTYWSDKGVRCNALSPGGVFHGQSDEFVQRLSSLIPIGRMAKKDEYCSAIQFLCSDASLYMNGQNIVMDGGRSVW